MGQHSEHPVAELRASLEAEFQRGLPDGVEPVDQYCGEPQFFPGATGLLDAQTWPEVQPGLGPAVLTDYPPASVTTVVVGNYQATQSSYQRIVTREIGGLRATWGRLGELLASLKPSEVFLTNAYVGLPISGRDTDAFPTTPEYTRRCGQLLAYELQLFAPRCVVCLGNPATKLVASLTDQLQDWRLRPSYQKRIRDGVAIIRAVNIGAGPFSAVSIQHPSARCSNLTRQVDAALVAEALGRSVLTPSVPS